MKRFLSLMLVVIILFSTFITTSTTVYAKSSEHSMMEDIPYSEEAKQGPAHSPRGNNSSETESKEEETKQGPAHNPRDNNSSETESTVEETKQGPAHNPRDNNPSETESTTDETQKTPEHNPIEDIVIPEDTDQTTCNHKRTREYIIEEDYKKYDEERHIWIKTFITQCCDCHEILNESEDEKKEVHNINNGKCRDCGYKVKNCEHEETKKVVSYWHNDVNERGNDASYVEYDIICIYCGAKVDTEVHYGPVTSIEASSKCNHDDVEENVVETYYELCSEEKHYKLTKYIVKCLECDEEFNSYTKECKESHEISNGKCTKCVYRLPKKEDIESESTNQKANDNTNKENVDNKTENSQKETIKTNDVTKKEPVEDMYIITEGLYYLLNENTAPWKNLPKETNGNLQVPIQEFAEAMGWTVTSDKEKNLMYVSNGKVTKTFFPNYDVYMVDSDEKSIGISLTEKTQIIDGVFYTDLDAMLKDTEYAYYQNDTMYRVAKKTEVIERLALDKVTGKNNITTSKEVYESQDYIFALNEKQVYIEQSDGSIWVTVVEPVAEQAWYGNYYEGETTVEGVIARLVVGEIPLVGTVADVRDVIFHIGEPEWTTETTLDVIAIIPFAGISKYLPELSKMVKNADEVAEGIEIIADLSKNTDEVIDISKGIGKITDATGTIIHADDLVKSADDVIDFSKDAKKVADAARASIKSVDDLKSLVKNPNIFAKDAIEHIFYGNSKGGLHYNGLSGSNGEITKITKAPNKYGVYEADVNILGMTKGKNTFFPNDWTPEEVIKNIEEAYTNGVKDMSNNTITYISNSGIKIQLNLDKYGKVTSAFPKY